jgi:hypothetical protein
MDEPSATPKQSSRTAIIVALIGLVGVLGGALLTNWDKVFPPTKRDAAPIERQSVDVAALRSIPYVTIWYSAARAADATALKDELDSLQIRANLLYSGQGRSKFPNAVTYSVVGLQPAALALEQLSRSKGIKGVRLDQFTNGVQVFFE